MSEILMSRAQELQESFRIAPDSVPIAGVDPALVEAPLTFVVDNGVKPVTRIYASDGAETQRDGEFVQKRVPIRDARALRPAASLDREGFALVKEATGVTSFADEEQIRRIYYPEVVRLISQATGAAEVLVFDHTLRLENNSEAGGRTPVRLVHNDYTERSGPQRVKDLLGARAAEAALRGRVAQVNLWRPIRRPIESAPLAVVDAQSLPSKDLIATDLVFADRVGEIYQVAHSPEQRWYSYPGMAPDEALLIKGYDSAADGRARFTPHSAFDDPNSPLGAAPRESIEVRTFVFFEPEAARSH